MTGRPQQVYQFASFRLDPADRLLYRDGQVVSLPPKIFDTLLILVANSGHVVGKDELMKQLWPDTFVGEGTLTQCISLLRKALGEGGRWIENHPRRGYRFCAPVEVLANDAAQPGIEEPTQSQTPLEKPITGEDQGTDNGSQTIARGAVSSSTIADRNATTQFPVWRDGRWIVTTVVLALLTWALLASRWSPNGISASRLTSAPNLVRLTSTSGLNTDPALAPDGTLVAYTSDRGGASGSDIWVQPVGGGDPLRVSSDPGDEAEPSFSPDSSRIVFSRRESSTIDVVGALGGEARVVVQAQWARTPRFSPDGRWIVYWTGYLPTVVPRGLPGATGSVFVVSSSGGSPHQLVPHFASARYPIWSPDSEHILFLGEENANEETYDWYVAARESGGVTKTGAIPALRAVGLTRMTPVPGAWRAGDDAVVFATNETGSSNIWQMRISRSRGRVSDTPQRLTFGTAIERGPSVAAAGRIAFTSVVENVGVWRAPLDPQTGIATGPFELVTDDAASERLRNVSRDGKVLTFISSRTGRDEVWIRDLGTGRERQLTHAGGEDASITPNGLTVAYSRSETGKGKIELVDTAGGLPSKLCGNCSAPFDWSHDGKRLLFNRGLPSRLVVHDLSSGTEAAVAAHEKWGLFQARFSPDGDWVAFHTANTPNIRQIYATPISRKQSTTSKAWVPVVSDHGCHPSWSSDGSQLYHFSFRDGAFCPWVQRVDAVTKSPIGEPRAVQHLHHPRLRATLGAAATNDVEAGYLYITATETTGNIWMLEPKRE